MQRPIKFRLRDRYGNIVGYEIHASENELKSMGYSLLEDKLAASELRIYHTKNEIIITDIIIHTDTYIPHDTKELLGEE